MQARLKLMRPGGVVLNFARAQIVNGSGRRAALDARTAPCLRLRFPRNALKGQARAIALPHLGARPAMRRIIAPSWRRGAA